MRLLHFAVRSQQFSPSFKRFASMSTELVSFRSVHIPVIGAPGLQIYTHCGANGVACASSVV